MRVLRRLLGVMLLSVAAAGVLSALGGCEEARGRGIAYYYQTEHDWEPRQWEKEHPRERDIRPNRKNLRISARVRRAHQHRVRSTRVAGRIGR